MRCIAAVLALTLLLSTPPAGAQPWGQFRGPGGQGVALAAAPPLTWSDAEHVAWKTELPGRGWSSPVLDDDSLWMTSAIESPLSDAEKARRLAELPDSQGIEIAGEVVLLLQQVDRASGELVRRIELFRVERPDPIHGTNSYASPTPVLDEGKIYCHFGTYGAACVNAKTGEVMWRNDEVQLDHQTGPGSSPIIYEDLLIVHADGTDKQMILAINKHTGQLAWTTDRSGKMHENPPMRKAFCTPILVEHQGRTLLISPAANWCYAYDPRTGSEIWKVSYGQLGFSNVARPVFAQGLVYVSTGFMKPELLAIRVDGVGDVSRSHVVWRQKQQAPKIPSPVCDGQRLYMVSDSGVATAMDAKTGEVLWRERLRGNFAASPLLANGRVYFFGQEGQTFVYAASSEAKQLAINELDAKVMATPAAVGDKLYLRTADAVYCLQ